MLPEVLNLKESGGSAAVTGSLRLGVDSDGNVRVSGARPRGFVGAAWLPPRYRRITGGRPCAALGCHIRYPDSDLTWSVTLSAFPKRGVVKCSQANFRALADSWTETGALLGRQTSRLPVSGPSWLALKGAFRKDLLILLEAYRSIGILRLAP